MTVAGTDLAEEGRNLIPRYAPEWTDFNVHDPGITLIELLAWIAEMDIYRLNRIPEKHRRKFLRLLSLAPHQPQAARTVVQFALSHSAAVELPASIEVETRDAKGPVRFRALEALTVVPIQLRELWREDESGLHDLTTLWQNGEALPMFGTIPQIGAAFYFGFSAPLPEGAPVTLFLRFTGGKSGTDERQRLQQEWLTTAQACSPPPNPCQPQNVISPTAAPMKLPHHSVRTVWDVGKAINDKTSWRTLSAETEEVIDDTRACTLDGFVRFTLPEPMSPPSNDPYYVYLRCRFGTGEYDAPPILQTAMLNAVTVEQAVPAGSEFTLAQNAEIIGPAPIPGAPAKFTLRFNAGREIQMLKFFVGENEEPKFFVTKWQPPASSAPGIFGCELRYLDKGLGEPSQEIILQPAPVQAQSVEIFTLEDEIWQVWNQRPDFDASVRSDHHFVLEATTGKVIFGDGEKGLPVPTSALIFAKFRVTVAEKGNVLAGKISRLADSAHNQALIDVATMREQLATISNQFPAMGGAEAETLANAEGRALEEVNRVTRAVTIADIEYLALATPGANLSRVAAKSNLDARHPCLRAPGMITVIILPNLAKPGAQPSSGLRLAVRQHLNRRRILGSRIEVVGPVYTKVTVQARVQSQTGADAARVQRDILQALHDFFDSRHGGPEKNGWPFGRDVYRSEVLHTIDAVSGVENVIALELITDDGKPSCGNLCIGPCGLVISGEHQIVVD